MRKFRFDKLVRDKIVDLIVSSGNTPHWKILSDEEYVAALKQKIVEEAPELVNATGHEVLEELADIQEIIDNLLVALKLHKEDLVAVQKKKNEKKGSFALRHYVDVVEVSDGAPEVDYYLKFPDKYPEVK